MSLPLRKNKYGRPAFVEPAKFLEDVRRRGRLPQYKIPKKIIFFFIPTQVPKLTEQESVSAHGFFSAKMNLIEGGEIGILSQFGFGAPALAIHLELLVAMGATEFIGVGTSGSLLGDVQVGDLILCSKALRDEGVSYHYQEASEFAYPSEPLNLAIREAALKQGLKLRECATWTTDAIYRETLEEVHDCRARDIHTVDMEASALFTIAKYRGVQAASLFAISDLLTGEEWQPHMHTTKAPLESLVQLAIQALK